MRTHHPETLVTVVNTHGSDVALSHQIELCKQTGPSEYDLRQLRHWLISSKGNNSDLEGSGWNVWEKQVNRDEESKMRADLVVLSAKHDGQDHLLKGMGERAFRLLDRLLGKRVKVMQSNSFVSTEITMNWLTSLGNCGDC